MELRGDRFQNVRSGGRAFKRDRVADAALNTEHFSHAAVMDDICRFRSPGADRSKAGNHEELGISRRIRSLKAIRKQRAEPGHFLLFERPGSVYKVNVTA